MTDQKADEAEALPSPEAVIPLKGPSRRPPASAYAPFIVRDLAIRWACNVVALFVAAWILSGVSYGNQWWTLFIAAAVFTIVNAWVKPLLAILSIPFIIVTLGLFYFLINVLMLYLTDWIVPDFEIRTFWWGVLAAIIVSLVNGALNLVLPDERSPET